MTDTSLDDLFFPKKPREDHFVTPESMSFNLARQLVEDIDTGDFELTAWETEFVGSILDKDQTTFSFKQKEVIYKLARRFHLL
jgi:hypothetical protein